MITTVVFDLDDTLYDEIDYCRSGFAAVAEHLSKKFNGLTSKLVFDVLWNNFSAGNRTKTFNAALDELKLSYNDKLITELITIYRNHKPDIVLPKDSRDVLDKLSNQYTLALLTDGYLPAQKLKVESLGIEKYFKCMVYTEELGRDCWKPSPAGFKKLLQSLDVRPENTAYIADNENKDFIAANQLGFLTIRLIRPAGIHQAAGRESQAAARYKINEIGLLPVILHKICQVNSARTL